MGGRGKKRDGDRGRKERDCCYCVLANLVNGLKALAGKQMFCGMDGIFSPCRLDSIPAAMKSLFMKKIACEECRFEYSLRPKTPTSGSI